MGMFPWPPRWGYLKENFFFHRQQNIEELKARIFQEVRSISKDILRRVTDRVHYRMQHCIANRGAHVMNIIPSAGQTRFMPQVSWSHTHTHTHTQSVDFPWTGDRPDSETSAWQHTDIHAPGGIRTHSSSKRSAADRSATVIGQTGSKVVKLTLHFPVN